MFTYLLFKELGQRTENFCDIPLLAESWSTRNTGPHWRPLCYSSVQHWGGWQHAWRSIRLYCQIRQVFFAAFSVQCNSVTLHSSHIGQFLLHGLPEIQQRELILARKTSHAQGPESPTITLTWRARTRYKNFTKVQRTRTRTRTRTKAKNKIVTKVWTHR